MRPAVSATTSAEQRVDDHQDRHDRQELAEQGRLVFFIGVGPAGARRRAAAVPEDGPGHRCGQSAGGAEPSERPSAEKVSAAQSRAPHARAEQDIGGNRDDPEGVLQVRPIQYGRVTCEARPPNESRRAAIRFALTDTAHALEYNHVMTPFGLADFIDKERTAIVAEWESFARTLLPAASGLNALALRDHADEILTAIIRDMRSRQTKTEQAEKSKGRGQAHQLGEMGQIHATLRIEIGFRLGQMVAEYRALRASVLRLWERVGGDEGGVTRFNESIDEALTVAVDSFTEATERYRDQSIGILSHDLRNPLSGIILGATMLLRREERGKDADRNVAVVCERILSSGRRMDRMICDLLDLTRTRFGKQIPMTRAPIDLEPLCRQVLAELEGQSPTRLEFSSAGDLRG
ncbi:MAG: Sensor histidine kinase [Myxococcales bacterium]|nr:Sensor histidine kinase [Myxococcales bacterium]